MPYVRLPFINTSTSSAPYRTVDSLKPSATAETGDGLAGSVMSMIWMTSISNEVTTMPYVRLPFINTSTSPAPSKASNPPEPSKASETMLCPDTIGRVCWVSDWIS